MHGFAFQIEVETPLDQIANDTKHRPQYLGNDVY